MAKEMKNSGIDWLGDVPKHWSIERTKNKFQNHKNIVGNAADGYERLALTLRGVIKRSKEDSTGLQPEAFNGYQILRSGELVFKLIDLENVSTSRVGLSPYTGIVSPAYIILTPNGDVSAEYAQYYFLSMWHREIFNHIGDDGVRSSLNAKDLLSIPFLCPPVAEQKRIAYYLDSKCAYIETVITKTKRTLEEYKKLRNAIITKAVTKGVREQRQMKDSGSAWFGEIPAEWNMVRLKYMFHIKKDIAGKEGFTILSITQRGITPKNISNNEGQIAADYSNYQLVEPGDFAMNHMDLLTGWVDISKYAGVTSPDYRVFVLDDVTCNKEYYLYMMQMCYSNKIFYGLGQGVSGMGRWRLQADKFLNFYIAVPPSEEQDEIVEALKKQLSEIDALIAAKEQLLTEMESYKKSVIYEYVTGKKEVPACQ